MFFVPFNSRDARHKSVFGSTAAGNSLWLCVCMPREMMCSAVYLVTGLDGEQKNYIKLNWLSTDGKTEWWGIEHSFNETGLHFYHFEYDTSWGRGRIFMHSEGKGYFSDSGFEWQQTVYSPDFKTPEDFKGGVMYQIYPDRFFCSGIKKENVPTDRTYHKNFTDEPEWQENKKLKRWNADFYGGDLKGIEQKLPYLCELGVTCIYLNPIFEAHSNHRYDTADYLKIDPLLGTYDDFVSLCKTAQNCGIKILLDGVFSHTGADSIYFNKFNRYENDGAYNSKKSPYYSWFNFKEWNTEYDSWWGIDTLPETNEEDESFCEFIAGEGGVVEKWLNAGAYGVRLDVADELPDSFIVKIRKAVKRVNPDGLLLGEVWEDASNKISHGGRRKYFLGDELDSVMNYPFRSAIIDFLKTANAEKFNNSILTICENYPPQVLNCLMNHLGTHDTERILSVLGGLDGEGIDRKKQRKLKLTDEQKSKATKLLMQAVVLQYTLPGVPCIYYGDEMLTEGLKDPFNRTFFPWNKQKSDLWYLLEFLGKMRKEYSCLKDGRFYSVSASLGCVAFVRANEKDKIFVVSNNNDHAITYFLPPDWHGADCITGHGTTHFAVELGANDAAILVNKTQK